MAIGDALRKLIEPLVEDLGYEFVGLEYLSNPKNRTVRLYIDRAGHGVGLEDCAEVSREVSALLDVEDPVAGRYTLEVSSPGIERPLFSPEHYQRFAGQQAVVHLYGPVNGRRKFTGLIVRADSSQVVLAVDGVETVLPVGEIRKGRLKPDMDALLAGKSN